MSKTDPKDFSEPPFDVYIHAADETLKFNSYGALAEWAEKQVGLWKPASALAISQGKVTTDAWTLIISYFNQLEGHATQLATAQHEGAQNWMRAHLPWLENGTRITADSPDGLRIIELVDSDPEASAARLVWAVRDHLSNHGFTPRFMVKLMEVGIEDRAGQTEPRVHKTRLTNMQKKWDDAFATTETRARNHIAHGIRLGRQAQRHFRQMKEFHASAASAHVKEMERIEKTFMEQMRLRAPATYWASRGFRHAWIAAVAFVAFGAVGGCAAWFLWAEWPELVLLATAQKEGMGFLPLVLVSLPALFVFWFLRLISRIFVTSMSAVRDAAHRSVMVQTYLALVAEEESGVTETDRLLILQALFRPENPAGDDDAPPPHLLEMMASAAGVKPK